jgi:hypothetical protein
MRYRYDPGTGKNTCVASRRSYTNRERTEIIQYWKTPSILDHGTGRLRPPTLEEVERVKGVPKSNVQRWAAGEEKIVNGRATDRKNRPRKGEMAQSKELSRKVPEPEVVSTCGGVVKES